MNCSNSDDVIDPLAAVSRRRWLAVVGGAGLCFAAQNADTQAAEVDLKRLPYIDAHSHVWSPDVARWPLAGGPTRDDLKPPCFTSEELLAMAGREGVGAVGVIQHSGYRLWENSYLIDWAERAEQWCDAGGKMRSRFSIVGMIDDRQPGAGEKLRELYAKGVRGLRITPRIYGEK